MKKNNINIKSSLAILAILFIAVPFQVQAAIFDIGNLGGQAPTQSMNQILGDFGLTQGDITPYAQMLKQYENIGDKKQPPQVQVTFSPTDPKPGESVTASASPIYFQNDSQNLYFTWYLKPSGCTDVNDGSKYKYNADCDLNHDGKVDIEDYKIKAMRTIASSGFDWSNENYSSDSSTGNHSYKAVNGGNDQNDKNAHCYFHNTRTGEDYEIQGVDKNGNTTPTCDGITNHLFPDSYDDHGNLLEITGAGNFGKAEEEFWHTNPHASDTANGGNTDEANVAGLGITDFTWNYTPGDQVGVVVEGVSTDPTAYADSSYKIMWALDKNQCENTNSSPPSNSTVTGNPQSSTQYDVPTTGENTVTTTTITTTTTYNDTGAEATIVTTTTTSVQVVDGTTGADIGSPTVTTSSTTDTEDVGERTVTNVQDINGCLYDNFLTPSEGAGQAGKMDITLSYTPTNPMNDPNGDGGGDLLTVYSTINNDLNDNNLNYTWTVYQGNSPGSDNPDDWDVITKANLPDASQTSGPGVDKFSFRLGMSNSVFKKNYLEVKVNVTEDLSDGTTLSGYATAVIPVMSTKDTIAVYPAVSSLTNSSNDPQLSLSSTQMCNNGINSVVCPVVQDQIIGLSVPSSGLSNISWTLDGDPIDLGYQSTLCAGNSSDPACGDQPSRVYFPVTEGTDHQYEVEMTATDTSSGKTVDLTKDFQVVDPTAAIASADNTTARPLLLGNYIDVNGKQWPDYSDDSFETLYNTTIKLTPVLPGIDLGSDNYVWYVDGNPVTKYNAASLGYSLDSANNLVLPGKASADPYEIGLSAMFAPDNPTKKALNEYWSVPYSDFYETTAGKNIEITSVAYFTGNGSAKATPGTAKDKLLANVFSSLPSYLAFLFRIVLTGGLLLFFSGFILSFFPRVSLKEDEI